MASEAQASEVSGTVRGARRAQPRSDTITKTLEETCSEFSNLEFKNGERM